MAGLWSAYGAPLGILGIVHILLRATCLMRPGLGGERQCCIFRIRKSDLEFQEATGKNERPPFYGWY